MSGWWAVVDSFETEAHDAVMYVVASVVADVGGSDSSTSDVEVMLLGGSGSVK